MNNNQITTLIKFPVISFRKIPSPYDDKGTKTYIAIANVKDLPASLDNWREINVRHANLNSGVAKKIEGTLKDNPSSFFFRNRGITVMSEKVSFNNENNIVEIEMMDKQRNGLLDGGHTFKTIMNFIEYLSEKEKSDIDAYVKIEILEGFEANEDIVGIIEARNTSTQVKEQGLQELRKQFEEIKKVLNGKSYAEQIAYKEYELLADGSKKTLDIKDILSYLICFDVEKFDKDQHPLKAYSTKAEVVKHCTGENHERILKYVSLLPKILELRDIIYLDLPEAYNSTGGKFGALTGVTEITNKPRMKKIAMPFTEKESRYRIPSGFIYPVLSAFRNLVEVKDEKCIWKSDPIKLFKDLKVDLAKRIVGSAKDAKNPNMLGKNVASWQSCYDVVRMEVLERNI